ncbi:ERAP1-like C-terminal domain-containing protein [Mycena galericulata]|nr:ERAP1-like C-terminal domain-containing protein [Mycena galericulata]
MDASPSPFDVPPVSLDATLFCEHFLGAGNGLLGPATLCNPLLPSIIRVSQPAGFPLHNPGILGQEYLRHLASELGDEYAFREQGEEPTPAPEAGKGEAPKEIELPGTIEDLRALAKECAFIALDTSQPFKLNASATGFYRVLYTSEKLNKLALQAAKGSICDMVALLNEAMALAKAGLPKLSSALTLMDGFAGTTEYIILEGIAANINGLLETWWEHPKIVERLLRIDRNIFVPLVSKLGYEYDSEESSDTAALRTLAGSAGPQIGQETVVEMQSH